MKARQLKLPAMILAGGLLAGGLSGCFGNNQLSQGFTNDTNTIKYLIQKQQDLDVLYKVAKWADGEGDEIGFVEEGHEDEGNKWTHYTRTGLYRTKPQEWEYDVTADELREMTKEEVDALRAKENLLRGISPDVLSGFEPKKERNTTTTTSNSKNSAGRTAD
ncbi:MAG: hypothetical protein LBQ05_02770 [Christensenellaceae bacterium]|jgi:hypothetical protein|nr:hypothetical protein [Christensenellaceae bacterium]